MVFCFVFNTDHFNLYFDDIRTLLLIYIYFLEKCRKLFYELFYNKFQIILSGADISAKNEDEQTPLHSAAKNGKARLKLQ